MQAHTSLLSVLKDYGDLNKDDCQELLTMSCKKASALAALVLEGSMVSGHVNAKVTEPERKKKLDSLLKKLTSEGQRLGHDLTPLIHSRLLRETSNYVLHN